MTLSLVDFDSRGDALMAAELAGYDASSVSIRADAESGRYQWHLRSFNVECPVDAGTASGADDDALLVAGVVADVVADMVAGLVADDTGNADNGLVGWTQIDSGTDQGEAPVVTDIVHGQTFDVVAHASADLVEAFGLDGLVARGLVIVDPASGAAEVAALLGEVDAYQAPVSAPVTPVVTAAPAGMEGDVILQIHGALPAMAARQIAERLAKSLTCLMTMRNAVTFEAIEHVTTASGTKRVSASASSAPTAVRAPREPAVHVETVIDRIKRGVWLDSEVPDSNLTILNLKHRIENAARAGDLDALRDLGTFKSTSTYYNQARAYLDFHLVDAPKRQAALDAEFTYGRLG